MSGATPAPARTRGARLRGLALAGLGLGALLGLVTGSRPWWRAAGTGVSVSFSGTESSGGLAQTLALVALAGALLALVLRVRGRRVLGVLLALTGVGTVVVGLTRPRPASGTVQSRVLEVSLADQFALVGTPWPYAYAVAGLVVLAAAVAMVATAGRWPVRAARFERSTTPAATSDAGLARAAVAAPADEDPAVLWRLLDAGVDPTAADPQETMRPEAGEQGDADHIAQPAPASHRNHPAESDQQTSADG